MKFLVLLLTFFSFTVFAGNGVERGSVMIRGASDINPEIKTYVGKILSKCTENLDTEHFQIEELTTRNERIDQGIIDVFYKIKLNHVSEEKVILNTVTIEILDSDFHNWRNYEEKLSFEVIKDQNKRCF